MLNLNVNSKIRRFFRTRKIDDSLLYVNETRYLIGVVCKQNVYTFDILFKNDSIVAFCLQTFAVEILCGHILFSTYIKLSKRRAPKYYKEKLIFLNLSVDIFLCV